MTLRDLYAVQTRQLILSAYADLLQRNAGTRISLSDVARTAGIAERTVYRHFAGRAKLVAALEEWKAQRGQHTS